MNTALEIVKARVGLERPVTIDSLKSMPTGTFNVGKYKVVADEIDDDGVVVNYKVKIRSGLEIEIRVIALSSYLLAFDLYKYNLHIDGHRVRFAFPIQEKMLHTLILAGIKEELRKYEYGDDLNQVEASQTSNLLLVILLLVQSGRAGALRSLLHSSSEAVDVVRRNSGRLMREAQRSGEREITRAIRESKTQNIPNFVEVDDGEEHAPAPANDAFGKMLTGNLDSMKQAMRSRPSDFSSYRIDGETPLIYHARNGNFLNVKELLDSGEYTQYLIEERDRQGRTAMQVARDPKIVKLLKNYGAAE